MFSVETKRLVLSKSAVNRRLRATMAFKQARFWTNVSYPFFIFTARKEMTLLQVQAREDMVVDRPLGIQGIDKSSIHLGQANDRSQAHIYPKGIKYESAQPGPSPGATEAAST